MRLFILLVGLVCVFGEEEVVEVVAAEQEEVAARQDVAEDAPAQVVAAPGHLLPIDLQRALYEEEIARRIGGGVGLQLGPIGLGVGGGLGLGGVSFGGGLGLGNYGNYNNYVKYPASPYYTTYYRPASPLSRAIGLGGGLQLGPIGLGLGGGFTPTGFKFGGGAGLGNYGQYDNYYTPNTYASYAPWSYYKRPVTTTYTSPASRHLGGGVGFNLGPLGFGGAVGLGAGGLNVKAGAGFNNQYQYYGTPQVYSQLYQPTYV